MKQNALTNREIADVLRRWSKTEDDDEVAISMQTAANLVEEKEQFCSPSDWDDEFAELRKVMILLVEKVQGQEVTSKKGGE